MMMLAGMLAAAVPALPAQQPMARAGFSPAPLARPVAAPVAKAPAAAASGDDGRKAVAMLAGLAGGAAGFLAGGFLGLRIEEGSTHYCYEDCGLSGFIIGSAIGEGIGFGVASYLAYPRPGKTQRILLPVAASGVGFLLAFAANDGRPLWLIPPLQLISVAF